MLAFLRGPSLVLCCPAADVIVSHGVHFHQYADDTQLRLAMSSDNTSEGLSVLAACVAEVIQWYLQNGLQLNPDKSEALIIGTANQLRSANSAITSCLCWHTRLNTFVPQYLSQRINRRVNARTLCACRLRHCSSNRSLVPASRNVLFDVPRSLSGTHFPRLSSEATHCVLKHSYSVGTLASTHNRLPQAPLKLRPYGAIQICLLLLLLCGFCPADLPEFGELLEKYDDQLFRKIMNNPHHTLHQVLPPQSTASKQYHLRHRTHKRQLPAHHGHLADRNFITQLLYKDTY